MVGSWAGGAYIFLFLLMVCSVGSETELGDVWDDLVTISVDTTTSSAATVNPLWFGCHMDLGFAHPARGIYSQLLYGESFEFGHNSTWSYQPEHGGSTDPDAAALTGIVWNKNGTACFDTKLAHHGYVSLHAPSAGGGASNRGMGNEGLYLEAAKTYEGYFYAHADQPDGATVVVALRDYITGRDLASTTVEVAPPPEAGAGDAAFARFDFTLTPIAGTACHGIQPGSDPDVLCGQQCGKAPPANCTTVPQPCSEPGHTYCVSDSRAGQCQRPPVADCPPCPKTTPQNKWRNNPHCMAGPPAGVSMPHDGHVCVKCAGELYIGSARGDVHIDYVFLQPGKWGRFGDGPFLKSGVQTLLDMGVTVIRLGGGFASESYYFWKLWRGLPEDRGALGAKWGSDLMSGFGPFEALQLGIETGIEIVVDTAAEAEAKHHGGTAYAWKDPCCNTSDLADLIEYVAGNASTKWGKLRIADRKGKTEPYPLRYIELGNEQINTRFLEQVSAMEARARSIGKPRHFSYIWPGGNYNVPPGGNCSSVTGCPARDEDNVDHSVGVESLGLGTHVLTDLHVGAGGGVQVARQIFSRFPNFTFGAVNAETNAGTHTMLRAAQEAADLNEWLNCFFVDGSGELCHRLKFRTASFCSERSGHFDAYDQGISMFLPNMTFLQPPGHVHKLWQRTKQPNVLRVNTSDDRVSVSGQLSDDGATLVVRLVNVNTTASQMVKLNIASIGHGSSGGSGFGHGELWTMKSTRGDILQCNTPASPNEVSPVKVAFAINDAIHLPPASLGTVVLQKTQSKDPYAR